MIPVLWKSTNGTEGSGGRGARGTFLLQAIRSETKGVSGLEGAIFRVEDIEVYRNI